MKKILVLFFALLMLLALTACNGNKETENNTVPATEAGHTHNYSSKVTTDATCGAEGIKTFTCDCGDSYTEKVAATGQHKWGEWETEVAALVGKDGTEKRTCTACSAPETRTTKQNATDNSFADEELQFVFACWNGENSDITGVAMLTYFSQKYEKKEGDLLTVSSAEVFQWLSARFVLTDALKQEMKQVAEETLRYREDTDSFEMAVAESQGSVTVLGYIQNSGNRYTVYFDFEPLEGSGLEQSKGTWKVEMEYNLINAQPNQYISVAKVNSVPDKVVG